VSLRHAQPDAAGLTREPAEAECAARAVTIKKRIQKNSVQPV